MEPGTFSGAVAGPGRRVSAEGRAAAEVLGGRRGEMAEGSEEKHFVVYLQQNKKKARAEGKKYHAKTM